MEQINFKLSKELHEVLRRLVAADPAANGRHVSVTLRRLIVDEARRWGLLPDTGRTPNGGGAEGSQ
jgi:hypothetical protein